VWARVKAGKVSRRDRVDRELYPVFTVLVTIRKRIWRGDKARNWEKNLLKSKKTHTRGECRHS
jgi:hypothetical protein